MNIPTIHTQRLRLRPLQTADAARLHRIYQVDGVLQYFPNPQPPALDRVERNLLVQRAHWEQHGYGNWGVVAPGQAEIIGWAGLQFLPETGETEVGFLLDKPFWGKGYATEAALASLKFGFEKFHFPEVIALVHPENLALAARDCQVRDGIHRPQGLFWDRAAVLPADPGSFQGDTMTHKMLLEIPYRSKLHRLLLRCYEPGDGPMYLAVAEKNRQHLQQFEPGNALMSIDSLERAEIVVREMHTAWLAREHFFLGAFERGSGEFAAQVYIGPVDWDTPEFVIGYIADAAHEGRASSAKPSRPRWISFLHISRRTG